MKKSTTQALSFISGLTIAAVAVGVTVSKNKAIRTEIENQLNNILSITKPLLQALKGLSDSTINSAVNTTDITTVGSAASAKTAANVELNNQWSKIAGA